MEILGLSAFQGRRREKRTVRHVPDYRGGQWSACSSHHCGTNCVNEADYHRS